MSIGFFIIGGIIFAVYIYLMIWNIYHSAKQSRKENYPNLGSEGCDSPLGPVKKVKETSL